VAIKEKVKAGNFYKGSSESHSKSLTSGRIPQSGHFLNTSVGLELTIGYTSTKVNDEANTKKNVAQVGIGLQFYLEKG
jgi:hypothetical protein